VFCTHCNAFLPDVGQSVIFECYLNKEHAHTQVLKHSECLLLLLPFLANF